MITLDQRTVGNRLLRSLEPEVFEQLAPHLTTCTLGHGEIIAEVGQAAELTYFPITCIASIIAQSPDEQSVEAGLYGRDGFGPTASIMGAGTMPLKSLIQVAGDAYSLPTAALVSLAETSPALRTKLLQFVHVMGLQTSFTALSNAVHQIDERLARWLLMCHDRSDSDELALTHEFMSVMLAVRRSSVTTSLHVLEGNHFISTERGYITIRNREALEDFASDAYGKPEEEYRRLFGPLR